MNHTFKNIGYAVEKLSPELIDKLWEEVNKILEDMSKAIPYNTKLVGHIRHEYDLSSAIPFLEPFILKMMEGYTEGSSFLLPMLEVNTQPNTKLVVRDLWVNFQKAGEFNPPHVHSGVFSFVIWLNIPYKIENELVLFNTRGNKNSCFELLFTDTLGNICVETFKVGKTHEGTVLMFPSKMHHCVHPFYSSEGFRISVSGNINFKQG